MMGGVSVLARKPRLCMVVHSAYPSDVRVAREVRVALREGYEVDVVAMREPGELRRELLDGVRVFRLPFSHRRGTGVMLILWEYLGFTAFATLSVAARMLRRRYDIVQIHNPPDFLILASVFPRLLRAKVILDIHDLSPDMFAMRFKGRRGAALADQVLRSIEGWAARFANMIITVHEPYARELMTRGVSSAKTAVVMNSLDEQLLPTTCRAPRSDCFRIVYHGTITPSYGVELLVEAAAALVSETQDLTLELYGEGDSLGAIRSRAKELGIEGNLFLSGRYLPQADVLEHVQSAHVGVIPNLSSRLNRFALSSKMLEYVALGVPVVSADLPTIREHFSDDEILFFRAGDERSLAEALRTVARDPDAARARAVAALRRYTESYNWSANAKRYASVLQDVRNGDVPRRTDVEPIVPRRKPASTQTQAVMFEATEPIVFFDHFRIPYRQVKRDESWFETLPTHHPLRSCGQARIADDGGDPRVLYWPTFAKGTEGDKLALTAAPHRLGSIRMHCRLLPERAVASWLADLPGHWRPAEAVCNLGGNPVSAVWRDDNGCIFVPFDSSEVISSYWSEDYRLATPMRPGGRSLKQLGLRFYYLLRPVIPRSGQLRFRRLVSKVQLRSPFPRWPVETALDDFYVVLFRYFVSLAGAPIPWISPWPLPYSWAFVLTHDVESASGYESLPMLRDLELQYGYRSSWNFVPKRYTIEEHMIRELTESGFEVGIHGLYHDGRDFASERVFTERLREVARYADLWNAKGFRSPSTHRVWNWMSQLDFDYDSSYPDTDPFEPYPGGCCSLLPYFNQDLVELPITLPQDHTLFAILGHTDESLWVQKCAYIKQQEAMALLITHPDYIDEPGLLPAYERVLKLFANDDTAWRVLPREISAWWRRRAASHLEHYAGEWRVVGPAAGVAAIRFATGGSNGQRPAPSDASREPRSSSE